MRQNSPASGGQCNLFLLLCSNIADSRTFTTQEEPPYKGAATSQPLTSTNLVSMAVALLCVHVTVRSISSLPSVASRCSTVGTGHILCIRLPADGHGGSYPALLRCNQRVALYPSQADRVRFDACIYCTVVTTVSLGDLHYLR